MELEDLKSAWMSVKPHIESQINEDAEMIIQKKNDVKSRLLKRAIWDGLFTTACMVLMALSPFWSPLKLPYWWLAAFCITILIAVLYGVKIYRSIKAIDLWNDTNNGIMTAVVSIIRLYRNLELATAIITIPLLIWLSFTPLFINSWRMYFTWGVTSLGFALEYLWYKSNTRRLNKIINWETE